MLWFCFVHYVIIFPTIFALLGTSRRLGLEAGLCNKQILSHHDVKLDIATKVVLAAKSTSIKGSSTAIDVNKSNIDSNAKIGAIIALVLLILQNSALTIFMRMTRLKCSKASYITSTAVVITELLKFMISLILFVKEDCHFNIQNMISIISSEVNENRRDLLAIIIPSGLYVLQNNLQFVAVSNLPAQVYQVLIQSKIITTAFFSYMLLSKKHTSLQWFSILLLAVGLGLVQLSFPTAAVAAASAVNASLNNYFIGFVAVVVSCFTSGYAGVYFERLTKSKPNRLWLRNMEMSFISILLALVGSLSKDLSTIQKKGFFFGYNELVLFVIFLQAFGGIIVSLVVKYTNSMVKGFATSGSIILSCILSNIIFHDFPLSLKFFVGTFIVVSATLSYSIPSRRVERFINRTMNNLLGIGVDDRDRIDTVKGF